MKSKIKFDVYKDMYFLDSTLTKTGIKRCKDSEAIKMLPNVELVFESPLKRALETAYFMFKDHPNFKTIKFVVHPHIREPITMPSDLPDDIEQVLKDYKPFFPNLDTRLVLYCT